MKQQFTKYDGHNVYSSILGYDQETDLMISFKYDNDKATVLNFKLVDAVTRKVVEPDDFNRVQIAKGLDFLMQRIEDQGERFIDKHLWSQCYILS